MIRRLALAAGLLLGLTGLAMQGTQTASAVTIGPHTPVPGAVSIYDSLVQPVQYGRCREVRRDCADRHGWGNWRWRRCVRYRGCGGDY